MTMYRFFEILPGTLSWMTLILMFILSWLIPAFVAVFIILFDIYWLLKTIYLSLHLRSTFSIMKKNLKVNWLEELKSDTNNPNDIRMPRIVEKDLSYRLTGIFFRVQDKLGRFARERQYGDALAQELEKESVKFKREYSIEVGGRRSNFADFIIEGRIVVELKTKPFIEKEDYYQTKRYLQSANLELGLIVNFSQPHLKPKRVLNPNFNGYSGHSDVFAGWDRIYHLVIFPIYREPYDVVKESFESLVKGNYPSEKFIVVLATEERAGADAAETAKRIEMEFGDKFFKFLITAHPDGLPGEIPGKGSNETWAAKEAKRLIIDPLISDTNNPNDIRMPRMTNENPSHNNSFVDSDGFARPPSSCRRQVGQVGSHRISYENILVSVFDIDTQIFPEYFARLTYVFLKSANRLRAIYQPIPLFINNVYQAPALARVISFSSTFWQMMQQSRPERLTSFSSQSIPFRVLLDIGFWHTDVVSEDSRIFWQCYLRYHGDFRVEPLLYPVSMDANAAPTFWGTLKNNYRQNRRWAWGCENIPYLMCGKPYIEANQREKNIRGNSRKNSQDFASSDGFLHDSQIPRWKKWYWSFNLIEGFHSWATNALLIFALGWLPVILGGSHFNVSLLSYSLPSVTKFIVGLSMVGVASSAFLSIFLLPPRYGKSRFSGEPPRPEPLRWYEYILYIAQCNFLSITLIIFGCIPALESQTRMMLGGKWRLGFWVTPKSRVGRM